MMCIYLGDNEQLTYKKQEHVFPAGLGGKQKLAQGIVSDQANELFSPLELKLMRTSFVSFDRIMFGPGKRGSLLQQNASKSPVNVGLQENGKPVLCYTAMGKPYNIPQFHLQRDEVIVSVPNEHRDAKEQFEQFVRVLKCFSKEYKFLCNENIPQGELIVGFFDDKYYVAASEAVEKEQVSKYIEKFLESFEITEMYEDSQHAKQSYRICENAEVARVYAKVAINTLAFLKGENYVRHPNFNEIKEWILTGKSENNFFFLPQIEAVPRDFFMSILPDKAHWCMLMCNNGNLDAVVCFYNTILRRFTLGKLPDKKSFMVDGFICDWQMGKEYTLQNFVNEFIRSNNSET